MKRKILIIIFIFIYNFSNAQDIIYKNDGTEIKAKIIELTTDAIKYKKFEQLDGPLRNISLTDVYMIIYADGTREVIKKTQQPDNNVTTSIQKEPISTTEYQNTYRTVPEKKYDGNYGMLGFGYGNSYGGLGARYQWRKGKIQGFGAHIGIGYFPYAEYLWSWGLKYFFYKDFYINAQWGRTGWEEYSSTYTNGSSTSSTYDGHVLKGYSFLIGGDWTYGKKDILGFNFGIGITFNTNVEYIHEFDKTVALDLGFLIKF